MDILNLSNSMGERAIRWLYTIALILIALGVIWGVRGGVLLMMRDPMPPPAVTASADAGAQATAPQPQQGAQDARPRGPRGMYRSPAERRFFMQRRHPMPAGAFMVVSALVRGLVTLLIVRILAEIGLRQLRRN